MVRWLMCLPLSSRHLDKNSNAFVPATGTAGRAMDMLRSASTRSWPHWTSGLWPEATLARLAAALDDLVEQLRREPLVSGVVLFGSYARGDYGRSSDVDLL